MTQPSERRAVPVAKTLLAALCALSVWSAWVPAPAFADVPSLLPIQGYLTDKQGAPVDGAKSVSFRLYSTPTGGTALHEETIALVAVDGYFTAYLGDDSGHPLDLAALRDAPKIFLGIEVAKDGEAVPRLQLAATAFAAQAQYCSDATNLGGKAPTAYAGAMHTHDWSDITGKPLTYPPTPHLSYADLGSQGYLDNNAADDLLTQSQGDGRYATKSHAHDATDIVSGTLNDARYSAYADLTTEGYLDGNASTDLLTMSQGDTRYVSPGEANTITPGMIKAGTIAPADLGANSVTMDKTDAPLGTAWTSQQITTTGGTYVFASPSIPINAAGTCVFNATARTTGTTLTSPYFLYPAVETTTSNGTTTQICTSANMSTTFCSGTYSYGMAAAASGTTAIYSSSATPGATTVIAGNSYRFGCWMSIGTAATYSCVISWTCN